MSEVKRHAACLECREKKMRCVPTDEQNGICERCARLGRQCRVPEVRPRKRKLRLRGRIDLLENNYAEIISLLKQSRHQPPASSSERTQSRATADPHSSRRTESLCQSHHRPPLTGNESPVEIPLVEREALLRAYRRMSKNNFPYVIIPEMWSSTSLITERPMLAQAIFIVTSWASPSRQIALKIRFIKDLSDRYFVKSERSLDLLQATIVYFAWCHWYAAPVACQSYRLGALVVSMAVELGINQRPASTTQHEMILASPARSARTIQNHHCKFWSYEARRAYIGAFVISVFCLLLYRKPSKLMNKQYLEECAASLVADPQYPSDETLMYMVRSLQIAELTSDLFDHGSKEKLSGFSDERVQVLVDTLSRQLDESKTNLPPSVRNLGYVTRQFYTGRAYIHEVGLYGHMQGQPLSFTRVSIIYECFSSASKYLSKVLDFSFEPMADWTCLDWRTVNFTVMLSTKCSLILNSNPCWATNDTSQRAAWLDKCIDTLCSRVEEFQSPTPADPNNHEEDYFAKLVLDWKNVKAYHQKWVQGTPISELAAIDPEYSDIFAISSFWGTQGQDIEV